MKLKYKFVVREIDGRAVAVAVGKDNSRFRGMIKLNSTGRFIFEKLFEDRTAEDIAVALSDEYAVSAEDALAEVTEFADKLRNGGLLEE